jgi:hypothetical protein
MNGITPLKMHINAAHVHLLAKRKLKLTNIVATKHLEINHNWYPRKKRATPFGFTITTFFGSTNLYKHNDETQQ